MSERKRVCVREREIEKVSVSERKRVCEREKVSVSERK